MDAAERQKAIELLKEIRQGGDEANPGSETRLTWMYKGPNDLVDREEYLLGKAIDKSFDGNNTGDNSDIIGRAYEPSNVPKRLLTKPESTEQVDIAKKILEDPLYAIKQKELEARRKLLDNPVKLKELKKMIMEKNLQRLKRKEEKKRKKKERKKSHIMDENKLNKKILKKLRILSESHRIKILEEAAQRSDSSSDLERKNVRRKIKKKKKEIENSSESYSGSGSESDRSDSSNKKKKDKKHKTSKKFSEIKKHKPSTNEKKIIRKNKRSGSLDRDDLHKKARKKEMNKSKRENSKHDIKDRCSRTSSSTDSSSESSSESSYASASSSYSSDSARSRKYKSSKMKRQTDKYRQKSSNSKKSDRKNIKKAVMKTENKKRKDKSSSSPSGDDSENHKRDRDRLSKQNFRSTLRDRSNNKYHSRRQNFNYNRNQSDRSYSSSRVKILSEKEREAKLKEMMENAKLRKEDREKNLAKHRQIQSQEDNLKDYDDDFMRRQISLATSQGTVADRIRSNVNNIQRSKSDMEKSFVRK